MADGWGQVSVELALFVVLTNPRKSLGAAVSRLLRFLLGLFQYAMERGP